MTHRKILMKTQYNSNKFMKFQNYIYFSFFPIFVVINEKPFTIYYNVSYLRMYSI